MGKSLYYHSLADAKQFGEIDLWRESRKENIRCANAIDEAIRNGFDGMHLDGECVKPILEEFGFQRVKWVLSNTLHELAHDGRFSQSNRKWLSDTYVPKDGGNYEFSAKSHPAVLDGFISLVQKEWKALGLYDASHCIPEKSEKYDYENMLVVFKAKNMKEDHLHPEEQLFFAESGFGCSPGSRGTKVFGRFLCDDERCHISRTDIEGILRDEYIPDWAKAKMEELTDRKIVRYGDDCQINIPTGSIDCSRLGYFDRLEEDCWDLVKNYMKALDIKPIPDSDGEVPISFDIVKGIQDHILETLQDAGVKFDFDGTEDMGEEEGMQLL